MVSLSPTQIWMVTLPQPTNLEITSNSKWYLTLNEVKSKLSSKGVGLPLMDLPTLTPYSKTGRKIDFYNFLE